MVEVSPIIDTHITVFLPFFKHSKHNRGGFLIIFMGLFFYFFKMGSKGDRAGGYGHTDREVDRYTDNTSLFSVQCS